MNAEISSSVTTGGLGRICSGADWASWHLPGGRVGPPARWAATSNVGESGTEEGGRGALYREGGLYSDKH